MESNPGNNFNYTDVVIQFPVGFFCYNRSSCHNYFILFFNVMVSGKVKKNLAIKIGGLFLVVGLGVGAILQWGYSLFKINRLMRFVRVVTEGTQVDTSLTGRMEGGWQNAISAMQSYPWGTGVDPVALFGTIDSGWLSYFAQGGLVLALLFSIYLLTVGGYGLICYFNSKDSIGLSLFALTIAIVVGSVVLSPFHHLPVFVVFHLLLYGVVMNRKEQHVSSLNAFS